MRLCSAGLEHSQQKPCHCGRRPASAARTRHSAFSAVVFSRVSAASLRPVGMFCRACSAASRFCGAEKWRFASGPKLAECRSTSRPDGFSIVAGRTFPKGVLTWLVLQTSPFYRRPRGMLCRPRLRYPAPAWRSPRCLARLAWCVGRTRRFRQITCRTRFIRKAAPLVRAPQSKSRRMRFSRRGPRGRQRRRHRPPRICRRLR